MLPSASRLKRKSDFGKVYARGRSYVTDLVVVYALPARSPGVRVGFSVSRKLGKSAARNHVKRLLREATRPLLEQMAGRWNVVVVARRKSAEASYRDLHAALSTLFRKADLMRRQPDTAEAQPQ